MIEREGKTIRIYSARWKAWIGVLIFGACTAGAWWLYQSGVIGRGISLMILIGVTGLGTLAMLFYALNRKPLIEMNEQGLGLFNGVFRTRLDVPWTHVQDVRAFDFRHHSMIGFELKPDVADGYGALARMSREMLGVHLAVPSVTLPGGSQGMLELIRAKWEAERPAE